MHVETPSSVLVFGLASKPTFTPSVQYGRNLLVGPRTWARRRTKGIQRLQKPCTKASVPRGLLNPLVDLGIAEDDSQLCYMEGTGFGSALFDARNGSNKLN
jgi:hypothetical protein